MLGASRDALAALRSALDAQLTAAADPAALSGDLRSVSDLLAGERSLRVALADPGQDADGKRVLTESVLGGRVSAPALAVVSAAAEQRWSADRDLVDALDIVGIEAALAGAENAGTLDRVEEEVFRFGRAVESSADLQMTLGDPAVDTARKSEIVGTLLEGKADPVTIGLVSRTVTGLRGHRLQAALGQLTELAARRRNRVVALVTAARPLDDSQEARLAAVLGRIYGRVVDVQVEVDPEVVGGVRVVIDDEVIDGTVASRLAQVKRTLAG
jgi:F-type H+-transporting ATPase subunit delta